MHVGHTATAVVTGKPLEMGGSLGRREATGRGVMIVARESAKHLGFDITARPSPMQGFGNVGSISAEPAGRQIGAKIVAVTDWKGGVYNADGPRHREAARRTSRSTRPSTASPAASRIANDQLFKLDVRRADSRRAREPDHDGERAGAFSAKVDRRGRQRPDARPTRTSTCTSAASSSLPDILANSSGVTASYFEWVQDRYGYFWTEKEVNERLEAKMCRGVRRRAARRRSNTRSTCEPPPTSSPSAVLRWSPGCAECARSRAIRNDYVVTRKSTTSLASPAGLLALTSIKLPPTSQTCERHVHAVAALRPGHGSSRIGPMRLNRRGRYRQRRVPAGP